MSDTTEAEFDLGNADLTIDGVSYVSAGAWKYRLANGPLWVPAVASASSDKDAPPVGPGLTPPVPENGILLRDGTTPTGDAITKRQFSTTSGTQKPNTHDQASKGQSQRQP